MQIKDFCRAVWAFNDPVGLFQRLHNQFPFCLGQGENVGFVLLGNWRHGQAFLWNPQSLPC